MATWCKLFALLAVCVLIDLINAGGGAGPASFDCPMRELILDYAQHIQPFLTKDKLQQVADALMGDPYNQNCTVSLNNLPHKPPASKLTVFSDDINSIPTIFIDPNNGSDVIDSVDDRAHFRNINKSFKTIQFGLDYLRLHYNHKKSQKKQILLRKGIHYLQDTLYFNINDSNLKISNYNGEDAIMSGAIPLKNLQWKLYKKSKNNDGKDIYSAKVPSDINITEITGLRVNSTRAIRCRYPNGNPEVFPPGFGSNLTAKSWYGAITNNAPDYKYHPSTPTRDDNPENAFTTYEIGIGGTSCYMFEPQVGFWCAHPHEIPTGMIYNGKDMPNAPYADPKKGVIQSWRGGGRFSHYIIYQ